MNALRRQVLKQEKNIKQNVDPRRFVRSSLFNETFVLRDVFKDMRSFWDDEEYGFLEFWSLFCEYADYFNNLEKENLSAQETYEMVILPLLQVLGYGEMNNSHLDNFLNLEKFEVPTAKGKKTIKAPLLIVNNNSDKKYLLSEKKSSDFINRFKEKAMLFLTYDYYDSLADQKKGEYSENKGIEKSNQDETQHLELNQRAVEYLNIVNNINDFAISTDGARWRLVHKNKSREDATLMYEFDISYFLGLFQGIEREENEENKEFLNSAKWFYWFFSKKGLCDPGLSFISTIESKSKKYASDIEEDMKTRFVHAVTICTNGYVKSYESKSKQEPDLELIVQTSESIVFNLFFLRSCESKGAIPFHQGYKKVSLANLVNKIEGYQTKLSWEENSLHHKRLLSILSKEPKKDGFEIYDHIYFLFESIKNNDNGFGITGFVESIFNNDELSFFKKYKLNNEKMVHLLMELMFHEIEGRNRQIPYNSFSPRQLGSMYESFLEFKPFPAKKKLYYLRKKVKNKTSWQWVEKSKIPRGVDPKSLYSVTSEEYIFSPDNKDRKSTGSFYTPHYVVEKIVSDVVGSHTKNIETIDDLLAFRICDPSMGSAHFLVEALSFLSMEYKRISKDSRKSDAEIRREVLDSCIYGADLNNRATKLAKMSLWLSSAYPGKKLEHLDDQLYSMDSLLEDGLSDNFFDAVVGNPPYVAHQNMERDYKDQIEKAFPAVLDPTEQYDLSIAFFKKSIEIAKDDGSICFIAPNQLSYRPYASLLRDYVWKNCTFEKVIDMTELPTFKDATTSPYIYFIRKGFQKGFTYPFYTEIRSKDELDLVGNEDLKITYNCSNQDFLVKSYTGDFLDIFEKIDFKSVPTLEDIVKKPSRGNASVSNSPRGKSYKIVKSKFVDFLPEIEEAKLSKKDFEKYMSKYGEQKIVMPRYFQTKFSTTVVSKNYGVGSNVYYIMKSEIIDPSVNLNDLCLILNSNIFSLIDYFRRGGDKINEVGFRALDGLKFCSMKYPILEKDNYKKIKELIGDISPNQIFNERVSKKDLKKIIKFEKYILSCYGVDESEETIEKLLSWWRDRINTLKSGFDEE